MKNKLIKLPDELNQFIGLIFITAAVILSFVILNIFFGQGDELVKKMKIEEERIAQERKLNELTSSLPSGILVTFDGTSHFKLTDELYEAVCNANKNYSTTCNYGCKFFKF